MAYQDYLLGNFTTGLLGHWPLGEASGSVVDDAHTSNRDGTVIATPAAYNVTGPGATAGHGGAMRFDSDSRVRLEAAPGSLFRVSEFTVACWFRRLGAGLGTTGGTGTPTLCEPLVTKGRGEGETPGQNCAFYMGLNVDGANPRLSGFFEESTGPAAQINGSTNVTNNAWHFAVFTYSATDDMLRLYLDGASDANAVSNANGPDAASAQLAAIAGALTTTDVNAGWFNGEICHVSIWNVPLTAANILNLYGQIYPPQPVAALVGNATRVMGTTIQVQLTDPQGAGINHATVTGADVKVSRNGTVQIPGVDYTFSYDSGTGIITLTCIGGNWPEGAYQVRLNEGQT